MIACAVVLLTVFVVYLLTGVAGLMLHVVLAIVGILFVLILIRS